MVPQDTDVHAFKSVVENEVRYANINIIEGTGASQLGIGVVVARIVEIIGRDEQRIVPIGSHHDTFGVTLSLPCLGRARVLRVLTPPLTADESSALEKGAETLRQALRLLE
jgi:L-lactate dehydrogenase